MHVPSLPINPLPNTHLSPLLYFMVCCTRFQASAKQSSCRVSLEKNKSPPVGLVSSFSEIQASRASSVADTEETYELGDCLEQTLSTDVSGDTTVRPDKIQLDNSFGSAESLIDVDQKERHRRRKIGLANKGKVPWNKGKKHDPEVREWISRRTKEALMDPKIRKKISENRQSNRQSHSEQTKLKIGYSNKRRWRARLKWKRSRAKFLSSWVESIAEAAKKGGSDQRELQWDSYHEIKEELEIQQQQLAADQTKAKEEKMARLARKREEQEQKAKAKATGEMRSKITRKSKEEREELAIAQELKLKERLRMLQKRRISTNGRISNEEQQAWEILDLEFTKMEQARKKVSLADQIQAVKTKRLERS